VLPGNCFNLDFGIQNCCRPGGITNIAHQVAAGFYFDAELDNASQGQNSSPIFVSEPVRAFVLVTHLIGNKQQLRKMVIQ
jgi:hypothetical protein